MMTVPTQCKHGQQHSQYEGVGMNRMRMRLKTGRSRQDEAAKVETTRATSGSSKTNHDPMKYLLFRQSVLGVKNI